MSYVSTGFVTSGVYLACLSRLTGFKSQGLVPVQLAFELDPVALSTLEDKAMRAGQSLDTFLHFCVDGYAVLVHGRTSGNIITLRSTENRMGALYQARLAILHEAGMSGDRGMGLLDVFSPAIDVMVDDPAFAPSLDCTGHKFYLLWH